MKAYAKSVVKSISYNFWHYIILYVCIYFLYIRYKFNLYLTLDTFKRMFILCMHIWYKVILDVNSCVRRTRQGFCNLKEISIWPYIYGILINNLQNYAIEYLFIYMYAVYTVYYGIL